MTDPARELSDMLGRLVRGNQSMSGDAYLANAFHVEPWSKDFFLILFAITDRIRDIESLIERVSLDEDYRQEMIGHLNSIATSFAPDGLRNEWARYGALHLGPQNLQPLKMLSGQIRPIVSYPKLSADDLSSLRAEVSELLDWLDERQVVEQEFIRQALIEGLQHFLFRLERFNWLGWGYTVDSLREVISAYLLLERQKIDANVNPDAAAVLAKMKDFLCLSYEKLKSAKDAAETVDWTLRIYGATSLLLASVNSVSGLLPSP